MISRALPGAIALLADLLSPGAVLACPVCFSSSNSQVLYAFYESVVAMTALPLVLVGLGVLVLRRRIARTNRGSGASQGDSR